MKDEKYIYPAITVVIFCVMFPSYWLWFAFSGFDLPGYGAPWRSNLGLDYFTWLTLGIMALYIYFSLVSVLSKLHNYTRLTIPLYLAIGSTVFMFGGTGILEFALVAFSAALSEAANVFLTNGIAVIFVSGIVIQGVIDIVIGTILLRDARELPSILTIFAIITLISGLLGATLVFAMGTILTIPISFLVLAIYFFNRPETLDVV